MHPFGICAQMMGGAIINPEPVWEADFRTLTLGDAGTLPGSLSFTRTGSGRSVQTSANTIMLSTGKSFNSNNGPRCGQPRSSASKGLCLESYSENVGSFNNYVDSGNVSSDLRDISNTTDFNGAGASPTYSTGTGSPDGVATATRCQVASGNYGRYRFQKNAIGNAATNNAWPALTYSTWQKSSGQVQQVLWVYDGVTTIGIATARTLSGAWERIISSFSGIPTTFKVNRYQFPVMGDDVIVYGGTAPAARNCEVDLCQVEQRRFAGSWMPPFSGAFRNRERLYHATRTTQILSGRVCLELTFSPMGSSTDYQDELQTTGGGTIYAVTEQHLWYVNVNNRGFFDPVTQKITTVVNGVSYVHNTALVWALGDTIQIWIEAGNGTPRASYRVSTNDESSWGSATALGTGAAQAALPGGVGDFDFLGRSLAAEDIFSCWVKGIRVFDNKRPLWVV